MRDFFPFLSGTREIFTTNHASIQWLSPPQRPLCVAGASAEQRFSGVSPITTNTEWMVNDYLVETVKLSTARRANSAEAPLCRPHARKVHVVQ